MKQLIWKNTNRSGSLAVEAAIMLPVFLIGMLTLCFLIRMVSLQENAFHSLTDELALTTAEANMPVRGILFRSDLKDRITVENDDSLIEANISPFRFKISHYGISSGKSYSDLVGGTVTLKLRSGLPSFMNISPTVSCTAIARAFTGKEGGGEHMPLSELEDAGERGVVWVFPRAGEKHHTEHCKVISNSPQEKIMSGKLRNSYMPCELCNPGAAPNGSLVYCFTVSGRAYHRGDCYLVERYVIPMSKKEAEEQKYGACSKCGGG